MGEGERLEHLEAKEAPAKGERGAGWPWIRRWPLAGDPVGALLRTRSLGIFFPPSCAAVETERDQNKQKGVLVILRVY